MNPIITSGLAGALMGATVGSIVGKKGEKLKRALTGALIGSTVWSAKAGLNGILYKKEIEEINRKLEELNNAKAH